MNLCLKGGFIASALVLCYSLIDIMAWLALSRDRLEVTKADFISWTESYVLPDSGLNCTAGDLYGARCGVLHTMTPDSRLSRTGSAVPVVYSWGSCPPYPSELLLALEARCIMIHVDTFCQAVERGALRFLNEAKVHKDRLSALNLRAAKLFKDDPRLKRYAG